VIAFFILVAIVVVLLAAVPFGADSRPIERGRHRANLL
jgi:hypothetical protein